MYNISKMFSEEYKLKKENHFTNYQIYIKEYIYKKLLKEGKTIINEIVKNNYYKEKLKIDSNLLLGNENKEPDFFSIDFVIDKENNPKLIEIQGFPTIIQSILNLYELYNKLNRKSNSKIIKKKKIFKELVLNNHKAENVIMLDYKPLEIGTSFDFELTEKEIGLKIVCVTKIETVEDKLFYRCDNNKLIEIKRIYNRLIINDINNDVIMDSLIKLKNKKVEWLNHPDWYHKISKNVIRLLNLNSIPKTEILIDYDLKKGFKNKVVKPISDYGGKGVLIEPTIDEVKNIKEKFNYIVQDKINFPKNIETPYGLYYGEYRLIYVLIGGKYVFFGILIRINDNPKIGMSNTTEIGKKGVSCVIKKAL